MSDDLRRAYLLGDGHSLYGNLPGTYPDFLHETANPVYAFAAMPRPFELNNDPGYHGRAGGRPPYATLRPLKADGGLNLQEKTWSGATYMLAPCPKTTDPQDVRSIVLEHAIESIRSGNGKWKNKTDCLVNHFNQTLILTSATLAIDDFTKYESVLFEYTFLNVQNSTHRAINIPQPGANEANFRTTVRYVAAEMTIDPRRRYAIPGQPGNQLLPGADTKVVLFRLPQGPNASLHDAITLATLRDIRQLITVCKYLQGDTQWGMLERDQFSQDKFNTWVEDVKQNTKYEIVAKLMRPAFVGEGIIETPVTRLVQCQQKGTNEKGQTTASTIAEHYARFTAIVQQLNPEEPYPVNLPTTFFNSLTSHMQDKLNRRHYRHPPPSPNQDQLMQLQKLRDMATEEERDIETQIQLIKSTLSPTPNRPFNVAANRGPYQQKPTTRTFMAYNSGELGNERHSNTYTVRPQYETDEAMDEDPLMEQFNLMENWMHGDPQTFTTCFLSPAESALRNASGTERPIECWGCTGHTTHHVNRFHSFRDCPNKYNPEVRRTAFRRMKQMREEWEGRKREQGTGTRKREGQALLTKAEAVRDWHDLGFNSKKDAEHAADAVALMAADVSARNRKRLNREWTRKLSEATDLAEGSDETRPPATDYYGPATRSRNQEHFADSHTYHFIARVFQAMPIKTLPLEISPTLPHCQFPIGPDHGKGKLKIALDSCAGVNIGHLEFHKAMAETFPELVASFKTMQEYGENDVTIGGVEVSATSLKLTHIIEYRTPFRYNGTACNLTFGLSENAAATAIVSINFLRKTKALWSYDDAEPNVHLTIWNTTLRIQYEPPTRRMPPTPQDRFRAETTAVYATVPNAALAAQQSE
jgi:hypothetical protein